MEIKQDLKIGLNYFITTNSDSKHNRNYGLFKFDNI